MQPKKLITKMPKQMVKKMPMKTVKPALKSFAKVKTSMPLAKKAKTVSWNPNVGKTSMMRKVRKSGVPASKKAGMIRQIRQNKI